MVSIQSKIGNIYLLRHRKSFVWKEHRFFESKKTTFGYVQSGAWPEQHLAVSFGWNTFIYSIRLKGSLIGSRVLYALPNDDWIYSKNIRKCIRKSRLTLFLISSFFHKKHVAFKGLAKISCQVLVVRARNFVFHFAIARIRWVFKISSCMKQRKMRSFVQMLRFGRLSTPTPQIVYRFFFVC